MKEKTMFWTKTACLLGVVTALSACVEIKSDAKIDGEAKVAFSTTYDLTRALPILQQMSKDADVSKNLSCDKMNEKLTKSLTCKDVEAGKFIVSGDFVGDSSNGVTADKEKNVLTVDAVQLFKTVADLNPAKNNTGATDPASVLMEKGLVPVALDQAAMYKQMSMNLVLNITMPGDIQLIDGAAAKDIKDNAVSVSFIDIAGQDTYVITSKLSKNRFAWKIIIIMLALLLIAALVWYLIKRKKKSTPKLTEPTVVHAKDEAVTAPHTAPDQNDATEPSESPKP